MESGNNSIHEWLANVTDSLRSPQEVPALDQSSNVQQISGTHRMLDEVANGVLDLTEALPTVPKISQVTSGEPVRGHHAADGKRLPRMPLVLVEDRDLPQKSRKRKRQDTFERRPRHKTREDRYEYKGSNTGIQQQSTSKAHKKKRVRQSRWHTMNDEFRASNVARERLTLRNNMNVGIFNKGKASTPFILQDSKVPDSAFVESGLPLNQHETAGKYTLRDKSTDKKVVKGRKEGHIRQQKRLEYTFSEYSKGPEVESVLPLQPTIPVYIEREKSNNALKATQCSLDEVRSPTLHRDQEDTRPQSRRQPESHVEDRRSATTYTWSDTSYEKSENGHEIEALLLNHLHKGLSSAEFDDASPERSLEMTYCDLDELRKLLRDRKSFWQSETSQDYEARVKSPERSTRKIVGACVSEKRRNPQEGMAPSCSTDLKPRRLEHAKSFQISDTAVGNIAELTEALDVHRESRSIPESIKQFVQHGLDVDRSIENRHGYTASASIDADFRVKMNPDTKNYSPTFHVDNTWKECEMETEDLLPAFPTNEPFEALLDERAPPLGVNDHGSVEGQASRFEKFEVAGFLPKFLGNDFSNRLAIPRRFDVDSMATHSPPHEFIPAGFWRQNRLY